MCQMVLRKSLNITFCSNVNTLGISTQKSLRYKTTCIMHKKNLTHCNLETLTHGLNLLSGRTYLKITIRTFICRDSEVVDDNATLCTWVNLYISYILPIYLIFLHRNYWTLRTASQVMNRYCWFTFACIPNIEFTSTISAWPAHVC